MNNLISCSADRQRWFGLSISGQISGAAKGVEEK
jgi:hypothetical protein